MTPTTTRSIWFVFRGLTRPPTSTASSPFIRMHCGAAGRIWKLNRSSKIAADMAVVTVVVEWAVAEWVAAVEWVDKEAAKVVARTVVRAAAIAVREGNRRTISHFSTRCSINWKRNILWTITVFSPPDFPMAASWTFSWAAILQSDCGHRAGWRGDGEIARGVLQKLD